MGLRIEPNSAVYKAEYLPTVLLLWLTLPPSLVSGFDLGPFLGTQVLLLALCPGSTAGQFRGFYGVPGIESRSALCKTSVLPAVLVFSSQSTKYFFVLFSIMYMTEQSDNLVLGRCAMNIS